MLAPLTLAIILRAAMLLPGALFAPPAGQHDTLGMVEVLQLKHAHDYFTLRRRLAETSDSTSTAARLAAALVDQAFNASVRSNREAARLLSDGVLPDSLADDLRDLMVNNDLRLFAYADGLRDVDSLLARATTLDSLRLGDARNARAIFEALAGVPPESVTVRAASHVRLVRGRIPVTIGDSARNYVFDTGANLSTVMRSEAHALGLRVIPAGIDVGTSTDVRVRADLAVTDHLTIGHMDFRHVVFLVLDDRLLTFGHVRIPGIIGFPVIGQMGEVRLHTDGTLEIPQVPPRRTAANLALDGQALLTPVTWGDRPALCRLDTGAQQTAFYRHFYQRYRTLIDSLGKPATKRAGGAGGIREFKVRVLSHVALAVGDTVITVPELDVMEQSILRPGEDEFLDCNLGHDILDAVPAVTLNFRDMAFRLR